MYKSIKIIVDILAVGHCFYYKSIENIYEKKKTIVNLKKEKIRRVKSVANQRAIYQPTYNRFDTV